MMQHTYTDVKPDTQALLADTLDAAHAYLERFHYWKMPEHPRFLALYVALTYVQKQFEAVPYVYFWSEAHDMGKSQASKRLGDLAYNPFLSKSTTVAYIYNKIEEAGAGGMTLILDEVDLQFKSDDKTRAALSNILNAGYENPGTVTRMKPGKNGKWHPAEYPTYGTKAINAIGDVLLPSTMSRCVRIECVPATSDRGFDNLQDLPLDSRAHVEATAQKIKDQLQTWAEGVHLSGRAKMPANILNRDAQIWRPLFLIAEQAGDEWLKHCLAAYEALGGGEAGLVVRGIRQYFRSTDAEAVFTDDLIEWLRQDKDLARILSGSPEARRIRLSALLRDAGYERAQTRVRMNGTQRRGYQKEMFV